MAFKVCVNKENEFILFNLDSIQGLDGSTLKLRTGDFSEVKDAFSEIETIELFRDDDKIGEYTLYDTYSSITYLGSMYVQNEGIFDDCIEVQLKQASLVDKVRRIERAMNITVDIDNMSVEEYRDYILKQISNACTQDIYLGTEIEVNGVSQNFSFKAEDQINLLQLYLMTKMYPTITAVPYHSDGNTCMFYTAEQIQLIYITLITRLISITTYVNQLNIYAGTLNTKEQLSQLNYGMELPEQYASVVDAIVAETVSALEGITNEQ